MLVCMYYAARHGGWPTPGAGRVPAVRVRLERLLRAGRDGHVRHELRGHLRPRELPDAEVHLHQPGPASRRTSSAGGWPAGWRACVGGGITIVAGLALPEHPRRRSASTNIDWLWLLVVPGRSAVVMLWACRDDPGVGVLNMSPERHVPERGDRGRGVLPQRGGVPAGGPAGVAAGVGLCLPTTYWLEGMRRALIGPPPDGSPLGDVAAGGVVERRAGAGAAGDDGGAGGGGAVRSTGGASARRGGTARSRRRPGCDG